MKYTLEELEGAAQGIDCWRKVDDLLAHLIGAAPDALADAIEYAEVKHAARTDFMTDARP